MKNKIVAIVIALAVTAIVGTGIYVRVFPKSEYEDINWSSYEHTDAFDHHYYLELQTKEKIAYENILAAYETFPEKIEIPELSQDELTEMFTALIYDNPKLFCFSKNCKVVTAGTKFYFQPEYTMSKTEYEARIAEINSLTPDIIANLPSGDYEVEKYLHDYIIERCVYTDTQTLDETTVYGALVDRKASCEGYSYALKYLADLCQIDCYVLFGTATSPDSKTGNHMWNIITIDGEKYHTDLAWNDTVASDDDSGEIRYMYFNVTDEEISKTHSDFETPDKCTSDKANYYVRNNLTFDDFGEAEKTRLAKLIAAAADDGKTTVSVRFTTKNLYEKAKNDLVNEQEIFPLLDRANKFAQNDILTKQFRYRSVDDVKIFEIMFSVV